MFRVDSLPVVIVLAAIWLYYFSTHDANCHSYSCPMVDTANKSVWDLAGKDRIGLKKLVAGQRYFRDTSLIVFELHT